MIKIKKWILAITLVLCLPMIAHAAGLTVSVLTEQAMSVNSDNALTARVGYYLGSENGGLEPFIGCVWFPREDTPQVITLGAIQHMADMLDLDSTIPVLPKLLLSIITEQAVMRPYFGAQCTINLIDRDVGFIEAIAGFSIKLTPEAKSTTIFETGYGSMFGDLSGRDDYELVTRIGFQIPFPKGD